MVGNLSEQITSGLEQSSRVLKGCPWFKCHQQVAVQENGVECRLHRLFRKVLCGTGPQFESLCSCLKAPSLVGLNPKHLVSQVPQLHQKIEISITEDANRGGPIAHQRMDPFRINLTCAAMTDSPGEVHPNLVDEISRARLFERAQPKSVPGFLKKTQVLCRRSRIEKPEIALFAPANFIRLRAGRLVPDVRQAITHRTFTATSGAFRRHRRGLGRPCMNSLVVRHGNFVKEYFRERI